MQASARSPGLRFAGSDVHPACPQDLLAGLKVEQLAHPKYTGVGSLVGIQTMKQTSIGEAVADMQVFLPGIVAVANFLQVLHIDQETQVPSSRWLEIGLRFDQSNWVRQGCEHPPRTPSHLGIEYYFHPFQADTRLQQ
jgi:hypothetical protein